MTLLTSRSDGYPYRMQTFLTRLLAFTLFFSAVLLFWIQPLFSKMVLPHFGGAPSVWNTCLVFFQTALFGGYLYVFLIRRIPTLGQMLLHIALLSISLAVLPIRLPEANAVSVTAPVGELLRLLVTTLGLPFFLLSATAPLLQNWFRSARQPGAQDPYFLYSASNAGSLLILLLFPFVVEPIFSTHIQTLLWSFGYAILLGLIAFSAVSISRSKTSSPDTTTAKEPLSWTRRLHWLAYSFVPSAYLYGVTRYITTDLAAVPLLWIIPLSLYLLTFVLAFSRRRRISMLMLAQFQPPLILPVVLSIAWPSPHLFWIVYPLHWVAFFVSALIIHQRLADSRPDALHLPQYYVWMSLGGMLGGVFCALLAPVLFNSILEYPLLIVLACLLRPARDKSYRMEWSDLLLPAIIALVLPGMVLLLQHERNEFKLTLLALIMAFIAWLCLKFRHRPARFAFSIGALVLVGILQTAGQHNVLYQDRSFYGVLRVSLDDTGQYRLFTHGTITHGAQSVNPTRSREPLTYFHRRSPVAEIFAALFPESQPKHMAVVGLGIGTLACYAETNDRVTFYEIDPKVVEIAQNPSFFTYLRDCPASTNIVLGDARLSLTREPDSTFDIICMDAFSSDAIPIHLVTLEATQLYFSKVNPNGVVLFQISNQFLDLEPVLAAIAERLSLVAYSKSLEVLAEEETQQKKYASDWVIMARTRERLQPLIDGYNWRPALPHRNAWVWTDDYSNILEAMDW